MAKRSVELSTLLDCGALGRHPCEVRGAVEVTEYDYYVTEILSVEVYLPSLRAPIDATALVEVSTKVDLEELLELKYARLAGHRVGA